jgi:hypothetical protein
VVPVTATTTLPTVPPLSADAFINLGTGPYPAAALITTGNSQAWYNSQAITGFFGGQPTDQQRTDFANTVLQRVQQTFQQSGVPVNLTIDPSVPAAHTLSVVSNTTSNSLSSAIGMTELGGNGFNFIDKVAGSVQSVDQLEWVVAHNVAHELMLAFGVPETHDQTGNFIDARNANLSMMLDPQAVFSQGAVQDLLSRNFQESAAGAFNLGAQVLGPLGSPVPEPTAMGLWGLAAACMLAGRRARNRRAG